MMPSAARRTEEERYGSKITGDNVMDYRTAPPFRLVLSPTVTAPTKADMEVVRTAMEQSLLRSLREEASSDDVSVQLVLGDVVELKFVAGEERNRQLRRRMIHLGATTSMVVGTARQTQQQRGYTEVAFDESRVTYTAPLLSDFTPPSQTGFEKKTFATVIIDAVDQLPSEIRTVAAETGTASGAFSDLTQTTADLSYVPPPIEERTDELVVVQKDPPAVPVQAAVEEEPSTEQNEEQKPASKEEHQDDAEISSTGANTSDLIPAVQPEQPDNVDVTVSIAVSVGNELPADDVVATDTSEDETPPVLDSGTYTGDKTVVAAVEETTQIAAESDSGNGSTNSAAIAGSVIAILAVAFLAALLFVKRRRAKARATKEGDVDRSNHDRTFELADEGELVIGGLHVEPAYEDANGRDYYNDDDEEDTNGYLPASYSRGGVMTRSRSKSGSSRKSSTKKVQKAKDRSGDDEDEDDSVLTDWSGGPSVNSLGHSVQSGTTGQGSAANLTKPFTEDQTKDITPGMVVKTKPSKHKKSKSMDLMTAPPTEAFEHQRLSAGISLRKDMMCTVESSGGAYALSKSRSVDHSDGSKSGPEAGWIWGSRNEADMKPANGYGAEMDIL